uniref:Uncharacterized protein n=1 Tax=Anguilla anguilla TaxID=7936 RepID=A0A0E9TBP2_ANGAN
MNRLAYYSFEPPSTLN